MMIVLIRYSVPNRFNKAPFGTIHKFSPSMKVEPDTDKSDTDKSDTRVRDTRVRDTRVAAIYYIQVSDKPNIYKWLTMAEFFEAVFINKILDKDFIKACLKSYLTHSTGDLNDK